MSDQRVEGSGGDARAFDDALDEEISLLEEKAASVREQSAGRMGRVDDRFRTRRVVKRSRHAWVLEAEHVVTGRVVALKVAFPNESSRARIKAEATVLGAIAHIEGVVSILDARVDGETASYLALEWLRGRSLEGILAARGALPLAQVLGVGSVLADVLAEIHAAHHVHGDLAPKHVFFMQGRRGRETVKVIDFGTSLLLPDANRPPDWWTAPEVVGKERTPASDVYALGAVLARALLGHPLTSMDELPKTPVGALLTRTLATSAVARPAAADLVAELLRLRAEAEHAMARTTSGLHAAVPASQAATARAAPAPPAPESAAAAEAPPPTQASPPAASPKPRPVPPPVTVAATEAPKGMELRKKARAGYVTPVRVTTSEGAIDGRSEDVSESGMLLVLGKSCNANDQIGLRFALPIDGHVVSCTARVAWSRSHAAVPGTHAVGVELVEPPADVIAAIRRYIQLMGVER